MPSGVPLAVYVQARERRIEIAGRRGAELKIYIAAPPVDQAANEALLPFLSKWLGVRRRNLRLIAGAFSRHKLIEIEGISAERLAVLQGESCSSPLRYQSALARPLHGVAVAFLWIRATGYWRSSGSYLADAAHV